MIFFRIVLFCFVLLVAEQSLYGLSILSGPTVISGTGRNSSEQIAIATTGKAMAIWVNNQNQIQASYFNGTTWGAALNIATGSFPQVGIDGSGNATAIWLSINISTSQIFTSRYTAATGTWSTPILQSTGGINASPQIAVNTLGYALAIWVVSSPQSIIATSYNPSTATWATPVTLATGTGFPLVVLDNLNHGIVTWTDPNAEIEALTVSVP